MNEYRFNAQATEFDTINAFRLGRAAKLAYETDEKALIATVQEWGFKYIKLFNSQDTQGFLAGNETMLLLAFRGTEAMHLKDWSSDIKFRQTPAYGGEVHRGFKAALDYIVEAVTKEIITRRSPGQPLWITGHSLGAALAVLFTAHLEERAIPVNGLYTFGSPRVGNKLFSKQFDAEFRTKTFRFVNNNDIVTRCPPPN
jgi:triacylglycerol lipase